MKRVLLDTNIVLDVLLSREPWRSDAEALWQANDTRTIQCYVTASSLTDIFYISKKLRGAALARKAIQLCLEAFEICAVTRESLTLAYQLAGQDFEDDLQHACASLEQLEAIVTRDASGYPNTSIPVWTSAEARQHRLGGSLGCQVMPLWLCPEGLCAYPPQKYAPKRPKDRATSRNTAA